MAIGILQDEDSGTSYQYDPTSQSAPTPTTPYPPPVAPTPTSTDTFDPTQASQTGGINGGGGATNVPTTAPSQPTSYSAMEGVDYNKLNDPSVTSEKYIASRILASGGTIQQAAAAIGATVLSPTTMRLRSGEIIDIRRDEEGANALQWLVLGGGAGGGADTSGGLGFSSGGTSQMRNPFASAQTGEQFDDPVTKEWEAMLRQLVDKLNTPQPMWSNSQLDLMQTQALDPLERQRQAEKKQMEVSLAARGMTPGSGPFIAAMQDIDRRFDQMRTQMQGGFATNAVGREDQLFNSNEQRNITATNMFKQIPQYADTRLQLAMQALQPTNPAQLLTLQNQMQQQSYQNQQFQSAQDQAYWAQLAAILMQAFT